MSDYGETESPHDAEIQVCIFLSFSTVILEVDLLLIIGLGILDLSESAPLLFS